MDLGLWSDKKKTFKIILESINWIPTCGGGGPPGGPAIMGGLGPLIRTGGGGPCIMVPGGGSIAWEDGIIVCGGRPIGPGGPVRGPGGPIMGWGGPGAIILAAHYSEMKKKNNVKPDQIY